MTDNNTTNPNSPWSIRGVSPNTKAFASKAAKKANLTVGEWIELAILEKIKNDKNIGKEVINSGTKEVDPTSLDNFFTMLQKMNSSGVEVTQRLSANANTLMNKLANDLKKGKKFELTPQLPSPENDTIIQEEEILTENESTTIEE